MALLPGGDLMDVLPTGLVGGGTLLPLVFANVMRDFDTEGRLSPPVLSWFVGEACLAFSCVVGWAGGARHCLAPG